MEIFEKILAVNTASGEEKEVREIIKEYLEPNADRIYTDKTGNLIAVYDGGCDKTGKTEKIAVFAPMDAAGLIVTYIESNGHIKAASLGKCDYRSACCSIVTNGKISGVLVPECESSDSVNSSYVDFGFDSAQEAEKFISQGDTLFFKTAVTELENGYICAPGLASKACTSGVCLAAVNTVRKQGKCIYYVFCTKSSLDSRGAAQTSFQIAPDKALCVSSYSGKEFGVKIIDARTVCDRELSDELEKAIIAKGKVAKRYVSEKEDGDVSRIVSSGKGVKTASILLPSEYKGSLAEKVRTENVRLLSDIITEFLSNI